jgi:hypothetical protein
MDNIMEIVRSKLEARHATHIGGKTCEWALIEIALDNLLRQFVKDPARHWRQMQPLMRSPLP